MSDNNFVRYPEGKIGDAVIDSWAVEIAINTFPTMSWRSHSALSGEVVPVTEKDNLAEMENSQTLTFLGIPTPFEATLSDGKGGELTFSGFELTPSYTTGLGAVGVTRNAIHTSSLMTNYMPYIYQDDVKFKYVQAEYPKKFKEPNLGVRIANIIEEMVIKWSENSLGSAKGTEKNIHFRNESIYSQVFSPALTESALYMRAIGNLREPDQDKLNSWLLGSLRSSGNDLFSIMSGIAREFKFFFVPNVNPNGTGYFASVATALNSLFSEKKTLDTVVQMSISPGLRSILPLTKVAVTGVTGGFKDFTAWKKDPKNDPKELLTFPNGAIGNNGRIALIPPPAFLGPQVEIDADLLNTKPAQNPNPGEEPRKPDVKREAIRDVCALMAELSYYENTLATSTATVIIDLDLSGDWNVGSNYEISTKESGMLFNGLLTKVTHKAEVNNAGGNAATVLNFTYVQIGGFNLKSLVGSA